MNPIKKNFIFAAVTLLGVTCVLELSLQVLAWVSPTVEFHLAPPGSIKTIDDPQLGWRPHPGLPDHDRNGFRNRFIPKNAAVVAMGDSQTYGYSVNADEAWPQQLAQLSGVSTYNMAYGGYSPVHSLFLWDEAMQYQPEVIIEAFYAGNDLCDAYNLVYYEGQLPALKSKEPQIVEAIDQAERKELLSQTIGNVYWMGNPPQAVEPTDLTLRAFVSKYCRIYGLLRAVKDAGLRRFQSRTNPLGQNASDWPAQLQFAKEHEKYFMAFDDGHNRTLLSHLCRSYTCNLDDPRIAEGHRIVLRANRIMARRARDRGARFMVLLIPSKELAFKDVVYRSRAVAPQTYHQTIRREERMWQATKRFFEEHQIEYIDTLPVLRQRLADNQQPFNISTDTHLNAIGHRVISQLVHARISGDRHPGTPSEPTLAHRPNQ